MVYKQRHEILANMLQDSAKTKLVMREFVRIVGESFKTDRDRLHSDTILLSCMHAPTRAEISARTRMCYDLFMAMRHDLHWSTQRSLDMLPAALRTELDGVKWEPQVDRQSWDTSARIPPPSPADRKARFHSGAEDGYPNQATPFVPD